MADGPFRKYTHTSNEVMARQVKRRKVVKTDRGEIVLHATDWEIIGHDGTTYGNSDEQFQNNFVLAED